MLNLEDTLISLPSYNSQRDLPIRGFVYAGGILIVINALRAQIAEVNLLQLIPGFYFFLLLVCFLYLLVSSNLVNEIPFLIDQRTIWGTKTPTKYQIWVAVKFSFFTISTGMVIVLNTLIPISLDFLNSTGEKTLENTWSFGEVLGLELFLLLVLTILFEVPFFLIAKKYNEKKLQRFPQVWKRFSILIFLFSGIITPTVDVSTQLSLAFATFSLYLIVITILTKRLSLKAKNLVSLY